MKKNALAKLSISILFSLILFLIFIVTTLITGTTGLIALKMGLIDIEAEHNPVIILIIALFASLIIGMLISLFIRPIFIKPLKKIIEATDKLASGDFSVRLNERGPHEMESISQSFNRMAEELGGIEVLRTDFINNFSHEFKTPIVSIKGFAEMLKYADLTEEQRNEYLDIVIDESARLSALATNVLNLSKIETQSILAETQRFNIGEQLRQCILLLDSKIEKKELELSADIGDPYFVGSKELLSQVWVNLLDNAIKFTPEKGNIDVSLIEKNTGIIITIKDSGCGIKSESIPHIFDKFYQADTSHATQGNGIGLAVAEKIIKLHGGDITVHSELCKGTTFTVYLPQNRTQ